MRRLTSLVACLLVVLLLSGCGSLAYQNITDLLRAPALGGGYDEIQLALKQYLGGEEPQYKFPKEGSYRSPIVLVDLDGDGKNEAVLLYSMDDSTALGREKGNKVYVAVLQKLDGAWQVVQDVQGPTTDVASLQVSDLLGDGTRQLIVGFASANLSGKTFSLYIYQNTRLVKLYEYGYSRYAIADFTGRGGNDLVLVTRDDDPDGLQLVYIPTAEGRFLLDEPPTPVPLDPLCVNCVGIWPSTLPDGERILVLDGVAVDSGALYSQVVYYSGQRFYTIGDSSILRGPTSRQNSLLRSRDIDGDGVVEIPVRAGNKVETPEGDKNLEFVDWKDFTSDAEPQTKQYGLLDSDRSVYVRLPSAWRGQVSVADGYAKNEWVLLRTRSQQTLMTMHTLEAGQNPPLGAVRVPGSTSSYLLLGNGLTEEERAGISMLLMNY